MKKVNAFELKYTQKQKELDDILYDISVGRHCDYYDGTIIAALHDDECDDLIKKYNEFFNALKDAHDKSLERTEYDETAETYTLLIDI